MIGSPRRYAWYCSDCAVYRHSSVLGGSPRQYAPDALGPMNWQTIYGTAKEFCSRCHLLTRVYYLNPVLDPLVVGHTNVLASTLGPIAEHQAPTSRWPTKTLHQTRQPPPLRPATRREDIPG